MAKNVFDDFRKDLKHVSRVTTGGRNYLRVDNIQGSIMYFPRHEYNMLYGMLYYGCWEPRETDFVKRIVKSGMVCIDVGAFVGYYTLLFAKLIGREGSVMCFEPLDEAREACMISAIDNGYEHIFFSKLVVSNQVDKIAYNADTLFAGGDGNKIDTIDLDTALLGQECVDFVKIDVEGNDIKVLEGMQKIIDKNSNIVIMMEYCPALMERCGSNPMELASFASSLGLDVHILLDNGKFERFSTKHLCYDSFPGKTVKELELENLYVETLILCRNFAQIENAVKIK